MRNRTLALVGATALIGAGIVVPQLASASSTPKPVATTAAVTSDPPAAAPGAKCAPVKDKAITAPGASATYSITCQKDGSSQLQLKFTDTKKDGYLVAPKVTWVIDDVNKDDIISKSLVIACNKSSNELFFGSKKGYVLGAVHLVKEKDKNC